VNNAEPVEDTSDYHVTTSQHARQAEDENDREVEGGRGRTRSTKLRVRRRKATNTLNLKLTVKKHVQRFAAVKAVSSVKVPLCSRASRSQLRPLTVTL
jgi:esterase/lipase superfamily enzyme